MTTETLITKVANAAQGHDSLGPTGLVVHLTPAERDKIVASLAKPPPSDVQVAAAVIAYDLAKYIGRNDCLEMIENNPHERMRAALTAAAQAGEPGKWFKRSLACEEFVIDNVVHGEITKGIEQTWCAMFHHRCVGRGFEDICDARAAVTQASGSTPALMGRADDGLVLLPRHLTPAMACALEGATQPPWSNGDPHGAIPQLVQDWQQKWADAIAAATKG